MRIAEADHGEAPGDILTEIGGTILHHVSDSAPLVTLPSLFGIDFSITKHVLMLWVAAAVVFSISYLVTGRYRREDYPVPTGFANAFESVVEFIRNQVVLPNVGAESARIWRPSSSLSSSLF